MSIREIMRRGWYQSIDDAGGGSGGEQDPPAEDPPAADPPASDPPAQDPPASDPPADDQDPPAPKPLDQLSDDEFAAEMARRGIKPGPEAEDPPAPVAVQRRPDFRGQAMQKIANDPKALENGWVDDEGDITPAGQAEAENEAMVLSHEWVEEQRNTRYLTENAATIETDITKEFVDLGEPEDVAKQMAKDKMVALKTYGSKAMGNSPEAHALRRAADVFAHGEQRLRELAARKKAPAADPADDAAPLDATRNRAPVNNGGGTNGNVYGKIKANPANKSFLEDWKSNHGREPTNKELDEMKRKDLVVI